METAKDLLTGEAFYKMRNNQKFANRKNQIRYNNNIANNKRKIKSSFDKVLDKNRTVLKNILGTSKEKVKSKDFLLGAGFNFNVLTNSFQENGILWYCVYEMAYSKAENNNFKIIQYA
ncbi:MAG: hypothetical protein AB7O73_15435 [Bacteroidia bacterium]